MQAGYDYLLLRSRLQRRLSRYLGIVCISFGLLLLAGSGAYYAYAAKAHSDLDDLNVNTVAAATEPREATSAGGSAALQQSTGAPAPLVSASDSVGQTPLKEALTPDASNHPWIYDPSAFHQQVLVREFTPVGADGVSQGSAFDAATRIMVPSVGIDSTIKELDIMELGDSRAYETPDKVVGHIPETVNPGGTRKLLVLWPHGESYPGRRFRIFQPAPNSRKAPRWPRRVYHYRQRPPRIPVPGHRVPGGAPG